MSASGVITLLLGLTAAVVAVVGRRRPLRGIVRSQMLEASSRLSCATPIS